MPFIRVAVVVALAGLMMMASAPAPAEASCITVTPCTAYEIASVIVQGTVTELADADLGPEILGGREYPRIATLVTIDVDKAWKGAAAGAPLRLYTSGRRSSIGFVFEKGRKYLVFAYERGGVLETSNCSHTNLIEKAGEDLAFLDTLSSPASGGRVYGRVVIQQQIVTMTEDPRPAGLSGRRLSLKGASGVMEAVSSEDGRYAFEGLQPGAYELDADLPKGWYRSGFPRSIELKGMRSCSQVDIWTAVDGRLSGHLVGSDGLPLARAYVEAALFERLRSAAAPLSSAVGAMTDEQGHFEFDRLPPGRYIVGVHLTRAAADYAPYRFAAYPGITQHDAASPIVLDTAQQLDLGVLTVARVRAKRVVEGSVRWKDGRPLIAAPRIVVTEVRPDWEGPAVRTSRPVRVEQDGRFVLELYEGISYRIAAETVVMRRPSSSPQASSPQASSPQASSPASPATDPTGSASPAPTPQAGRAIVAPGSGGRGAFSFGGATGIRSNTVDLTVTGDLPIITLVLDEGERSPDR